MLGMQMVRGDMGIKFTQVDAGGLGEVDNLALADDKVVGKVGAQLPAEELLGEKSGELARPSQA